MRILSVLIFLTFLGIHDSFASIRQSDETENTVLVTIKISDTFFQIPEKYMHFVEQRVPVEADQFHARYEDRGYEIKKIELTDIPEVMQAEPIFDDIGVKTHATGEEKRKIFDYIRSIATKTAPPTWEKDIALAKHLKFTRVCTGDVYPFDCREEVNPDLTTYEHVKQAAQHRNQGLKILAMKFLSKPPFKSENETKILFTKLLNDSDPTIRKFARFYEPKD